LDGRLLVFLDEGDVGVLMFITTVASNGTIHDDGEDPEQPEENTDTTAKNEGDSATLPATQMQQSMVEALSEGTLLEALMVEVAMMVAVRMVSRSVMGMGEVGDRKDLEIAKLRLAPFFRFARSADWHDVEAVGVGLDERHAEELPESVGDFDALLAHATRTSAAWLAGRDRAHLSSISDYYIPNTNCGRKRNCVAKANAFKGFRAVLLG